MRHNQKIKLSFEFVITLISMIIMIVGFFIKIPHHYFMGIIMFLLASFLVWYLEFDYFKVYKQLKTWDFTMDFLIAIAIHVSYFYSLFSSIAKLSTSGIKKLDMEFWEVTYELAFFIGLGHYIENKLKLKTSLGIKDLLKLQNKKAHLLINNDYVEVNSNQLKKGDIVKVRNGEFIPTDGILISKEAYLDYASLLGEPLPKTINKDQTILSGSINVGNVLIYQVTKEAKESTLLQIVLQLEKIINNKSKIEIVSQKVVKFFLPSILTISLITFIVWLILNYQGIYLFKRYDQPIANAIYNAVATLVIACPCAFGIAAPAAIYSSSLIASKNKILFSSAKIYEMISNVSFIAFDKTGTITKGKPQIKTYQFLNDSDRQYIYSLSSSSSQPLSKAISEYFKNEFKEYKLMHFDLVQEIPGIGIKAYINEDVYTITSLKYAQDNQYEISDKFNLDLDQTISVFSINKKVKAIFIFDDFVKEDARDIVDKLHKLGFKTIIISGDNTKNVAKIAKKLNIDYWYGDLMPDQKASIINEFKKKGKTIFVGDGINDVLAVKSADVSFTFASGSDITNSLSDVTLLENNLSLVLKTITLAKRTLLLVRINFIWAFIFNLICIPLAVVGFIPPWLGSILMTSSTSFLLVNTLFFKKRNNKIIHKI